MIWLLLLDSQFVELNQSLLWTLKSPRMTISAEGNTEARVYIVDDSESNRVLWDLSLGDDRYSI